MKISGRRVWGAVKVLLWLPVNAVQLVWLILWSVICITLALLVRLMTGSTRLPLGMARWLWAPGLLIAGLYPCQVRGLDKIDWSRAYFFASNHQSFLDIPLLFRVLPVNLHFVVKSELGGIPFLAWYIKAMGMIFVKRSNPESARRSIERAGQAVQGGKSILLFPEGTRSRDGSVGTFRSGMLSAAIAAAVPVVPIALEGPGRGMPRGWLRFRPAKLWVAVGEPVATEGLTPRDRHQLAERVRARVSELHAGLLAERV